MAERIKAFRGYYGLEQTDIADVAGIHVQTVSRYERAVLLPKLEVLQVWSERYGVRLSWWLTGEGPIDYMDQETVQEEIYRLFATLSDEAQRGTLGRLRKETLK
jgi:transcriptional regulator with XRE-family HTH domain